MARFVFMNGISSDRRRFMAGKLYAESLRILTEKVSRRGMPDDIPRTWILTRRDRALAPKVQHKYIVLAHGGQLSRRSRTSAPNWPRCMRCSPLTNERVQDCK
jgi:hypothetical protein